MKTKFKLLTMLLILNLISGCFLIDNDPPEIIFDTGKIYKINNKNFYIYNMENSTLSGKIKDRGEIEYMKIDDQEVQLNQDNFEILIPEKEKVEIEVADVLGNKETMELYFHRDVKPPEIKSLLVNNATYRDDFLVAGEKLLLKTRIEDDYYLEKVTINGKKINQGEYYFFEEYLIKDKELPTLQLKAVDLAGNIFEKELTFKYDEVSPELSDISIEGFNYYEGMNIGEKLVNINVKVNDASGNQNRIIVNNDDKGIIDNFEYTLDKGKNIIEIIAIDRNENETEKDLEINYIDDIPVISNITVEKSQEENIFMRDDKYYTNQDIDLKFDCFSGSDELELLKVLKNGEEISSLNGISANYKDAISINSLIDGLNEIEYIIENDAHTKSSKFVLKIFKDVEEPEANLESNKIYINKDVIILEDNYIDEDNMTDNVEIESIRYTLEGESLNISEEITLEGEIAIPIIITDIAGNQRNTMLHIVKDKTPPKLNRIELYNGTEIESENGQILLVQDKNDLKEELNIQIEYSDNDGGAGLKNISYGEVAVKDRAIKIKTDDIRNIKLEDNIGNITEVAIKVINFDVNKPSIFNNNTKKYYVENSSEEIEIVTEEDVFIWEAGNDKPESSSMVNNFITEGLNGGENLLEVNISDGKSQSKYSLELEKDVKDPIIKNITVGGISYTDSTKVISENDELRIDVSVMDESGIKSVKIDENSMFGSDGKYTYTMTGVEEGEKTIQLDVTDNMNNTTGQSISLRVYKLKPIDLKLNSVTENTAEISWENSYIPYNYSYGIYEESPEEKKITTVDSSKNSYMISGLNDNQEYSLLIKIEGENFRAITSNYLTIATKNRTPQNVNIEGLETRQEGEKSVFQINWEKVKENDEHDFQSYMIYRSIDKVNFKLVNEIGNKDTLSYVDGSEEIEDNELYHYKVKVLDKGGKYSNSEIVSEYSYNLAPDLSGMTFAITPENSGFYGEKDENNRVKITGKFKKVSNESDISTYYVWRTVPGETETFSKLLLICGISSYGGITEYNDLDEKVTLKSSLNDNDEVEFTESGLKEKTEYRYRVEVRDGDKDIGEINDNNMISNKDTDILETMDLEPLSIELNTIEIIGETDYSITFAWDNNTSENLEEFEKYIIYRKLEGEDEYENIKEISEFTTTTFTDKSLDMDQKSNYTYKIVVEDRSGNTVETTFSIGDL